MLCYLAGLYAVRAPYEVTNHAMYSRDVSCM